MRIKHFLWSHIPRYICISLSLAPCLLPTEFVEWVLCVHACVYWMSRITYASYNVCSCVFERCVYVRVYCVMFAYEWKKNTAWIHQNNLQSHKAANNIQFTWFYFLDFHLLSIQRFPFGIIKKLFFLTKVKYKIMK